MSSVIADQPHIADFDLGDTVLPGVTPARQKRSQDTMRALLQAGEGILRRGGYDDLSIDGLCNAIGASVGAFYARFESKDAFLNALEHLALAHSVGLGRQALAAAATAGDVQTICRILVEAHVGWMRAHEGTMRAALQRSSTDHSRWAPFKAQGQTLVRAAIPLLLKAMTPADEAASALRIAIAYQVLFGVLVNIVLNDPGPLRLRDAALEDELTTIMVRSLAS
ncbi:TetR/AcrR family transcriptional regulator [Zavarzinia sp. CC-PAN008]|uniref:TetR/AcrR family transcriptional regulator n=1 Tax=Zavarzinia sp. CC-PAN008 TaxID=3243332 RepID=UPI003F748AF4